MKGSTKIAVLVFALLLAWGTCVFAAESSDLRLTGEVLVWEKIGKRTLLAHNYSTLDDSGVKASSGFAPGFKLGLEKGTSLGTFELSGFFIHHKESSTFSDPGENIDPIWNNLGGSVATDASDYFMKLTTDMVNLELNLKNNLYAADGLGINWLAGLRYISYSENLKVDIWDGNPPSASELGDFRVKSDNQLIGLQLGAELKKVISNWTLTAQGKVGLLYNFTDTKRSQTDPQSAGANYSGSRSKDAWATLLEASAGVGYNITPSFNLFAKYTAFYLDGLATAGKNVPYTAADWNGKSKTSGNAFYHGPQLGLTYSF